MKRHLFQSPIPNPKSRRAFTLVEMLVVITIIGILASMITAAAVVARRRAKIAAVTMEVKQLEMACQAYKEKFGEYPPDFSSDWATVKRHISRAFPRYNNTYTTLSDFVTAVENAWGLPAGSLVPNPGTALIFWLGGRPILNGTQITGFNGFSADPSNPFDIGLATPCASRIKPFYDFNPNHVYQFKYWPTETSGNTTPTGTTPGPIVYFRAENKAYMAGASPKLYTDLNNSTAIVRPAVDTRLSNLPGTDNYVDTNPQTSVWINPASVQIFTSGLDERYSTLNQNGDSTRLIDRLYFPTGDNYAPETYDDITNFSGGTLEDAIP